MEMVDFETQALEALPFDDVLLPDCAPHGFTGTPYMPPSSICRCSTHRYHSPVWHFYIENIDINIGLSFCIQGEQ